MLLNNINSVFHNPKNRCSISLIPCDAKHQMMKKTVFGWIYFPLEESPEHVNTYFWKYVIDL